MRRPAVTHPWVQRRRPLEEVASGGVDVVVGSGTPPRTLAASLTRGIAALALGGVCALSAAASAVAEPFAGPPGPIALVEGFIADPSARSDDAVLAVSPDDGRIATLIDRELGDLRDAQGLSWSPDGQALAVAASAGENFGLQVVRSGIFAPLIRNSDAAGPAWSPGGQLIAYVLAEPARFGSACSIRVLGPDGQGDREVARTGVGNCGGVAWAPDSSRLVYASASFLERPSQLFIVPLQGGSATPVTSAPTQHAAPTWSPDGGRIAFSAPRSDGRGGSVNVVDLGSGAESTLIDDAQEADWAPGGSTIAFIRSEPTGPSVWIAAPDGSGQRRVASPSGASSLGGLSWGAAPRAEAPAATTRPPRATQAFRFPSNRRCLKRPARLRLAYLRPKGFTTDRVELWIGRKRLVRRSGSSALRSITLRKLPAMKFTLTIKVTPRGGQTVTAKRTYRVCKSTKR